MDKLVTEGAVVAASQKDAVLLQEYRAKRAVGADAVAVESRSRMAVHYKAQLIEHVKFC